MRHHEVVPRVTHVSVRIFLTFVVPSRHFAPASTLWGSQTDRRLAFLFERAQTKRSASVWRHLPYAETRYSTMMSGFTSSDLFTIGRSSVFWVGPTTKEEEF